MHIVYVLNDRSISAWPIYRLLVQADNIDTVRFLIPRYYDTHDLYIGSWRMKLLSESNVGEYINLTAEIFSASHISVDWIPRSAATASSGALQFELECVLPDYLYQTHVAEILVDSNLDITSAPEFQPSVLATFLDDVEEQAVLATESQEEATRQAGIAAQAAIDAEQSAETVMNNYFTVVEFEGETILQYNY